MEQNGNELKVAHSTFGNELKVAPSVFLAYMDLPNGEIRTFLRQFGFPKWRNPNGHQKYGFIHQRNPSMHAYMHI